MVGLPLQWPRDDWGGSASTDQMKSFLCRSTQIGQSLRGTNGTFPRHKRDMITGWLQSKCGRGPPKLLQLVKHVKTYPEMEGSAHGWSGPFSERNSEFRANPEQASQTPLFPCPSVQ